MNESDAYARKKIEEIMLGADTPALKKKALLRLKMEGATAASKENYERAVIFYTEVLKQDPSNLEALDNRADIYLHTRMFVEAFQDYKSLIEAGRNDELIREGIKKAQAGLAEQQSNKKSSPPSTPSPLSSSPDKHSSASPNSSPNRSSSNSNSSGEFRVSPDLPAKMTLEERRQKDEFIRTAKQEIPEIVRQMRESIQAEANRLAKEIRELPLRKKQAEEAVERINRALKDAKIPVDVELNMLGKKPYNKWKESTKVKYLMEKKTLGTLLAERQQARSSVGECSETIPNIEAQYNGFISALSFFDRLAFETEDFNTLYEYAKPIIERFNTNSKQEEISQLHEWFIQEKLKAISQADVDKAEAQLAEVESRRTAYIQDVVQNQFPAVKAHVLSELDKHQQQLRKKINELDRKIAEEQEEIQREEAQLRSVGIHVRSANGQPAVNAGRFGLHKSVSTGRSQQPSIVPAKYAPAPPPAFK